MAVGEGQPPADLRARAGQVINASNMAVMPGMVNAHTHLFQTFIRGLADDKTLLPWLAAAIWPVGTVMGAEEAYLAGLLGLVENPVPARPPSLTTSICTPTTGPTMRSAARPATWAGAS